MKTRNLSKIQILKADSPSFNGDGSSSNRGVEGVRQKIRGDYTLRSDNGDSLICIGGNVDIGHYPDTAKRSGNCDQHVTGHVPKFGSNRKDFPECKVYSCKTKSP